MEHYLQQLKEALASCCRNKESGSYVDLAAVEKSPEPGELAQDAVPEDALAAFQEIMMKEIAFCNLDRIQIGINELLKKLLLTVDKNNEPGLSERYLYRLRLVLKRCLMSDFPFAEEVWNYICACLRSSGNYLLDRECYIAVREIIDFLAGMGRVAALRGLPTANTQSSLRMLENRALAKDEKHLASAAKNARFNLET